MNDGVSRPPNISPRFTGLGPRSSGDIDRQKHEQVNKTAVNPDQSSPSTAELAQTEELSLSLSIIRALIAQDLPPEVGIALSSFAELGDLSDALPLCDRIGKKGQDHIRWPNTVTLRQALEQAAS
jgi:hypothetical protein